MKTETKVSTLFNSPTNIVPIELVGLIDNDYQPNVCGTVITASDKACDYDNVKLIAIGKQYDIIACWDGDDINNVCVYLGHWNDGVI